MKMCGAKQSAQKSQKMGISTVLRTPKKLIEFCCGGFDVARSSSIDMRKGLRNIADKSIIFKFEGFLLDSKTGSASLINKKQIQFFGQV